jgi:hypothetical protein
MTQNAHHRISTAGIGETNNEDDVVSWIEQLLTLQNRDCDLLSLIVLVSSQIYNRRQRNRKQGAKGREKAWFFVEKISCL